MTAEGQGQLKTATLTWHPPIKPVRFEHVKNAVSKRPCLLRAVVVFNFIFTRQKVNNKCEVAYKDDTAGFKVFEIDTEHTNSGWFFRHFYFAIRSRWMGTEDRYILIRRFKGVLKRASFIRASGPGLDLKWNIDCIKINFTGENQDQTRKTTLQNLLPTCYRTPNPSNIKIKYRFSSLSTFAPVLQSQNVK